MSDVQLYNALYDLREKLKNQGKIETGRTPTICSDEALSEMAEMKPRTLDDLAAVNGVGKSFIDRYGSAFLEVIRNTDTGDRSAIRKLDGKTSSTLKKLEQKLVNLNGRNPMLFSGKKQLKKLVDVYREDRDVRDMLFGKTKKFVLCDSKGKKQGDPELKTYNSAKTVVREADKIFREKGENNLYVAYPYVIGKLPGEEFDVRAPLVLIPVNAEKTATKITLSLDEDRDPVYNSTLLLAFYKFNQMNSDIPQFEITEITEENLEKNALEYYSEAGLEISSENAIDWSPFTDYTKSEFPKYSPGELYVERSAGLGIYSAITNSIQRDIGTMIETGEANDLLLDLIKGYDEQSDFYAESFSGIQEIKDDKKEVKEKDLFYINDLNSAQEKVLYMMRNHDELVIQGPPGTGKSQTIASLITEFVNDGKTVLMVSEKKTAIEVVYSRLGRLSRYALMVDDVSNKQLFYEQVRKMMEAKSLGSADYAKVKELNDKIDKNIKILQDIATRIYTPDHRGFSQYNLYCECGLDVEKEGILDASKAVANASSRIPNIPFDQLKRMHSDFSNPSTFRNLSRYDEIVKKAPLVEGIPSGYSELDLDNIRKHLATGLNAVDEFNRKGFVGKLFGRGKMKKAVMNAASKDFDSATAQKVADLLMTGSINKVEDAISNYDEYQNLKPLHDKFGPDDREYMRVMSSIPERLGDRNDFLYDSTLYWHIKKFESQNRDAYKGIDDFDSIFKELGQCMADKRKAIVDLTEVSLAYNVSKIRESKNYKEFDHQLNGSKRKWSVDKFIRRYRTMLFTGVKVWMMTPDVVSELLPLEPGLFDLLIFDEASQMFIEKGLPSIMRAKKVVIAGDHKQLRPNNLFSGRIELEEEDVEDRDITAALEEESLLDLARAKFNDVLLSFHYRSRYEELIAFSNYAFYGGRLYVSPNANIPDEPPIKVHMVENAMWKDSTNLEEAKEVVNIIKNHFKTRKNEETMGIITFNSNQRDLIEDLIDEECKKDPKFALEVETERNRKSSDNEDIGLFVKNIENVQGDERDEIVFSIGYAKNTSGKLVQRFGWLNQKGGENRLNVAISRAKKKKRIVLSFNPDDLQVETAKNEGPRILKKYLRYAIAVSDGNSKLAEEILKSLSDSPEGDRNDSFDSPFEEQVCDSLRELGYDVQTQVGIGGYRIDMAVRKEGRYVLGIECDGKLYHSSLPARERDYHRQKYLESRGWKIHRIWSSNWWNNPKGEIEKIRTLVESL